ncbi:MAG: flap endonuclease-1 [Candidatus Woesearchaeota archaeon]
MGVQISEILPKREIDYAFLKKKVLAVDAHLTLYQFLTTIRQQDGSLLTDADGSVTSHLMGIITRNANLLSKEIFPVYVFDGKPPELKMKTLEERKRSKLEAQKMYEEARELGLVEEMKKYASRTARLTPEMIEESKELLRAMGIPVVNAPSEGEAQAAYIVKKGDAFAAASQDADCLLFGTPRLVRNLNITSKKKIPGTLAYKQVPIELIELEEVLSTLGLCRDQLIALAMLVGTDFNPGGIRGIGPKNALKLVKKHGENFDALFNSVGWRNFFEFDWKEVFELIKNMPTTDDYNIRMGRISREKVLEILCEKHQFSRERVEKLLSQIEETSENNAQKGLSEFFR